jgi:hypothetical protein
MGTPDCLKCPDPMANALPEIYLCPECGIDVEIRTLESGGKCPSCNTYFKKIPAKELSGTPSYSLEIKNNKLNGLVQYLFAVALTVILSCGQNEPLANYEPKSSEEKVLKSVLLDFEKAVNNKDFKQIENLFHERASIMIGRDRQIFSKEEYIKILPKRLADDPYMALGTPKMKISGDKAEIKIFMTRRENNFLIIFNMKQENDKWHILSWDY